MDSIELFWEEFRCSHASLLHPACEAVMDALLVSLRRVDPRFYFHVGEHDEGQDLILSAEGHCDALPLLQDLHDRAPQVPSWDVVAAWDGDLLLGRRNSRLFPPDENGVVLWQLARSGDDLCVPREIDFSVVFDAAEDRRHFLATLEGEGLEGRETGDAAIPWDVTVSQRMLPTHANIGAFEERLYLLATPFQQGGQGQP